MANTIASGLQLSKVLDSAFEAFKRALAPLNAFSTVFQNVPLQGTNKVAVPYYPLDTAASSDFAGTYSTLASATDTQVREITINKRKVKVLSFTSEERARQPMFDPARHGRIKGQKLAYDIIADILDVVSAGNFPGSTLTAMASSAFDENDVADLAQKCMEAEWPGDDRSLVLNPAFFYAVMRRPLIIQADMHGSTDAQYHGDMGTLLGFDVYGTNGMPTNLDAATVAITATASDNVITSGTPHGLQVGDRVVFPALAGGTGLTAGTTEYFVLTVPSATTYTVSATPGGTVVDITVNYSSGTTKRYENLAGFACLPSAILVAGAPITPAPAVRNNLVDYQVISDESGLALEYREFGLPDTDTTIQSIECNYGYAMGEAAALKRITTA